MTNTYIQPMKDSVLRIIKLTFFGLVVMLGTAFLCSKEVNAASAGNIPVICFTPQEFQQFAQTDVDIVDSKNLNIATPQGPYPVRLYTTKDTENKTALWVSDGNSVCLLGVVVKGSNQKVN